MGLRIQALLGYGGSGKTHFYAALMLVAASKLPGLLLYVAETNAACTEFMNALLFLANAQRPSSANWQKLKTSFLRVGRRRVRDKRYELRELSTDQEKEIYLEVADITKDDFHRLEGVKILAVTKDTLEYLVQRAEAFEKSLMGKVSLLEVDEATQMTEGEAIPLLPLHPPVGRSTPSPLLPPPDNATVVAHPQRPRRAPPRPQRASTSHQQHEEWCRGAEVARAAPRHELAQLRGRQVG